MNAKELFIELRSGKLLDDLSDFEPGLSSNGGRYMFTIAMDGWCRLWIRCSHEDAQWFLETTSIKETWKYLKGIAAGWDEQATYLPGRRYELRSQA